MNFVKNFVVDTFKQDCQPVCRLFTSLALPFLATGQCIFAWYSNANKKQTTWHLEKFSFYSLICERFSKGRCINLILNKRTFVSSHHKSNICCVFPPAFGCWAHPLAGQNIFPTFFDHFKPFFSDFTAEITKKRLKINVFFVNFYTFFRDFSHEIIKKGLKWSKICFYQLLGARSTQKLVKIHNKYSHIHKVTWSSLHQRLA